MAWSALIAPDWPQLQAIIERDVVHRADQLTRIGWAGAVTGMHRNVVWHNATVEIRERPNGQARLDGRGLLFVPSVFIYPGLAIYLDPPWRPALVYPARGSAALWAVQPRPPGSLRRLLGTSRAHLLFVLDTPTSTTQLVATTGMSLGAVGGHLRTMLDAGLLSRARSGRTVLYQRTPVGEALLSTTE
jgi:DNA-binding transcriptional ArsR family regulator